MCTYILVLRSTRSGHRALGSGELILQNERKLRRSEGSGMLIGDPLGEGSNASSTHNAQKGAACS